MIEYLKTYRRQIAMLVLITAGYGLKKFAPLAADEIELLDALWVVLGFGAVFTPNFAQAKRPE